MEFGPYRTLDVLGRGGMGIVYRAVHRETGEVVAVKAASAGPGRAESLRAEARALARVHDGGVIRLLSQGIEDGAPWYAMEYVTGGTLEQRLGTFWHSRRPSESVPESTFAFEDRELRGADTVDTLDTPAPAAAAAPRPTTGGRRPKAANGHLHEVLDLFHRLCHALAGLHANGVVHRDLKPANVFVRGDGTLVVADLGLVSRYRGAFGRESFEVHGQIAGTPHYMAPEQARGLPVDARADLYALGAMLYEALTGATPFASLSASPVLQRILYDTVAPPSEQVEGVPAELDALVLRLLDKEPRRRFGYAEDVAAVLVRLGATPDPRPFPTRTYLYRPGLVGRREPLEEIRAAVDAARTGRGGIVLIHGESGVGKTTLAATAAGRARTQSFAVLGGECLPDQATADTRLEVGGIPFHPLRGFLFSLGDALRADTTSPFRAAVVPALAVLAAFEPSLGALPEVAALPPLPPLPPELSHLRAQDALRTALKWWTDRRGPTLLVLDDLQWVDEHTAAFLQGLDERWLSGHPLLVVGTLRPSEGGEAAARLRTRTDVHHITLGRLDADAVGAMVSDMLAWDQPSPRLVAELHRMSEGNPFFVAEYLRLAAAERILVRRDGSWLLAASYAEGGLPEPASIRELVVARLHGLDKVAMAVVEAAAVLGRVFPMAAAGVVAGVDEAAAEAALREIVARQIAEPAEGDELRFSHDRLREAVYQGLAPERRVLLHAAAAAALERELAAGGDVRRVVIGRHWREAGDLRRAVDTLEKAGEEALRSFANHDAVAVFREILNLAEQLPEKPGVLREARWHRALAEASLGAGNLVEGIARTEAALRCHGEPPLPTTPGAQAFKLLGQVVLRVVQGWFPSFYRVSEPAQVARVREAAYLYNRLLEPTLMGGQAVLAMFFGLRNLNLADRGEPSVAMVRGYGMMAAVLCVTPMKKLACGWADVGDRVGAELGDPAAHAYALQRGAVTYLVIGAYAEARRRLEKALAISTGLGDIRGADESVLALAIMDHHQGRFRASAQASRRVLDNARERSDAQVASLARSLLVLAADRLGDTAAAAAPEVGAALTDDLERLTDTERMLAHTARAALLARSDDLAGARAAAGEVLALCRKAPPLTYVLAPALDTLAEVTGLIRERAERDGASEVAARVAEHEEACSVLDAYAKAEPHVAPLARARRGVAHQLSGKAAKAEASLREAMESARVLDQPYARGLAAGELARRLRPADASTLAASAREDLGRAEAAPDLVRLGG